MNRRLASYLVLGALALGGIGYGEKRLYDYGFLKGQQQGFKVGACYVFSLIGADIPQCR